MLRRSILIATVVSLVAAGTALAAKDFEPYPYGARGDRHDVDGCEAPGYIVGFAVKWGAWFDKIGIICSFANETGTALIGGTKIIALRGGDGGGPLTQYTCPANSIVKQASIWANEAAKQVESIELDCTSLAGGGDIHIRVGGVADVDGNHVDWQDCPTGEAAWAMDVNYGNHVNAVGIRCRPYQKLAPIPNAPPQGCLIGGVFRNDIEDADCKEAQNTGCIRHLLTKKQYEKCLRAQPPPPPSTAQINSCQDYGDRMSAKVTEAAQLNCGFLNGPGGWNKDRPYFEQQCLEVVTVSTKGIISNERALAGLLDECKTSGGGTTTGGGETATMVNATTVYNQPGGNDVCYTQPGDTGKVLQKQDGEPRWVLLSGITGDCGGKNGWVWRGDENEDVTLN